MLFIPQASAGLVSGIADSATSTTATGTLDGVVWNATSTFTSPFLGANVGSGVWDVGMTLPTNALFLGTSWVNAGDSQAFYFESPVSDICFYVENFDSSSLANISTDANLSLVSASSSISFTSTGASTAKLGTTNSSYDGEGDAILMLSGPVNYVQFDYLDGEGANGVFYGFAKGNVTAVPEPSSLSYLMICSSLLYAFRRRQAMRVLAGQR